MIDVMEGDGKLVFYDQERHLGGTLFWHTDREEWFAYNFGSGRGFSSGDKVESLNWLCRSLRGSGLRIRAVAAVPPKEVTA